LSKTGKLNIDEKDKREFSAPQRESSVLNSDAREDRQNAGISVTSATCTVFNIILTSGSPFKKRHLMTQKTEENSANQFGQRLKTALKNLGIGIVFLIAGLFLLWHNETKIMEREQRHQAELVLSENGEKTAETERDDSAESTGLISTTVFDWSFRIAGWVILFLGLATLFRPLVVLVDKIPLLGNFVGRGITVFAFLSSLSLSLILVSAVWMVARPVIGAILLLAGVIPLLVLYRTGKRARLKEALRKA
tara:strand:+ start:917 stop:1666 length:750 start_codon:yes stop_codon:yes gene_type:complete